MLLIGPGVLPVDVVAGYVDFIRVRWDVDTDVFGGALVAGDRDECCAWEDLSLRFGDVVQLGGDDLSGCEEVLLVPCRALWAMEGEDDAPPLLSERVFEGDDVCMLWLDWQVCFNEPPLDRVGEIEGVHDGHDATAIMRALVPNGSWCAMLPAAFACESETAVATVALPRRLDAHRLGGRHAVARAGSG